MTSASADSTMTLTGRSDGAWTLAGKRFWRDRVGVAAALVVLSFIVLSILTGLGWLAADWQSSKAVGFAPPSFIGSKARPASEVVSPSATASTAAIAANEFDQLAPVLAQLRGANPAAQNSDHGIVDPLEPLLQQLRGPAQVAGDATSSLATSLPFGSDKWGRDVLDKVLKGTQVSLFVGLASAVVATLIGVVMGSYAGYYGGKIDLFCNWLYSVFNSIPNILLVLGIAAVLQSKGVGTVVLILGLTGWSSVFRLIRAEYLKHRSRDYVRAAEAIGTSDFRKMFVHILPNISHVILVNLSILVVLFIKSEVILSFLGFGVPVDTVSWGSMLNEAQNELILGHWWQLAAATLFMAVLVTAFSLFTDALRDALDPKLK
jgi:peptide/nickel transport system permease protein